VTAGARPLSNAAKSRQRGVTLIELMIAVTLVAAISTGMLMSIRTALAVLQKTDHRITANRRVVAANRILYREIADVIPAIGNCGAVFHGNSQSLRLVTSYSIGQGSRGAPQVVQIAVVPGSLGGLRLIANESPYYGPVTTMQFCGEDVPPPQLTPQSFILADRLVSCQISYKGHLQDSVLNGPWIQRWITPDLPAVVHIDVIPMAADPADLPLVSVTVPLPINREVMSAYVDSW
jgi:prepilin-type N-terminal cleavage/methylation domain-containing protein